MTDAPFRPLASALVIKCYRVERQLGRSATTARMC